MTRTVYIPEMGADTAKGRENVADGPAFTSPASAEAWCRMMLGKTVAELLSMPGVEEAPRDASDTDRIAGWSVAVYDGNETIGYTSHSTY